MDAALEALVAQASRAHNMARNERVLRVLCFVHVLCCRGFVPLGAVARRLPAFWNETCQDEALDPEAPAPCHALPCQLELPVRGVWRELGDVCGTEIDAPREFEGAEEGLISLLHATDAALEGFDALEGLCGAFEEAASRVTRDRRAARRPDPVAVEDGFRRYRSGALIAIGALRDVLTRTNGAGGDADPADAWPAPETRDFRQLQLVTLRAYEVTLVSPGVTPALLARVQGFVEQRLGS